MNYCEDCVLVDLCGNEGCLDDALTFCDDKQKFIRRSVIEDIKAEIAEYKDNKIIHAEQNEMIDIVLAIIDRHINGKENE